VQFGCSRFCSIQSTQKPRRTTSIGKRAVSTSIKSTYFLQISIAINKPMDLLWEQRVGGSNPSAPTSITIPTYLSHQGSARHSGVRFLDLVLNSETVLKRILD
jgi:hypothetical protein